MFLLADHLMETSVMRSKANITFIYFLLFSLWHNNQQKLAHYFCFFKRNLFIYLFSAALGRYRTRAFSSCSERGLLFVAVHGLLIVVASLVAEHGL